MPTIEQPADRDALPGLRERHKINRRRALEDAALRLFARNGFDETTIEAIAAEADLSPRTFFRYFSSKDQVLFVEGEERLALLRAEIDRRADSGLDDIALLIAALVAVAPDIEPDRQQMILRQLAAETTPMLRGRLFDVLASWERTLAEGLAELRGTTRTDAAVAVAAAVCIGVFRTAMAAWLAEGGESTPLAERVLDAYDHLSQTFRG